MTRSRLLPVLSLSVILLLTACGGQPRAEDQPSIEEQAVMARLTRDPYIDIIATERRDNGWLLVKTSQGSTTVNYIIRPEKTGEKTLNVYHLQDTTPLSVGESERRGIDMEQTRFGR